MISSIIWIRRTQTKVAEEDGEKDESVKRAEHHDSHVHAEVEDLEELRRGEGEDDDSTKFR